MCTLLEYDHGELNTPTKSSIAVKITEMYSSIKYHHPPEVKTGFDNHLYNAPT